MNDFSLCLALAEDLVRKARAEAPPGFDPLGYEYGSSDSNTNSSFRRTGTTTQAKNYNLPGDLTSAIRNAFTTAAPSTTNSLTRDTFLYDLLNRNSGSLPGVSMLQDFQQIDPSVFTGGSALSGMIARNPYSTDYETGIGSMFDRMYEKARTTAQSGPQNVRGGQARQGFEMAELGNMMSQDKFNAVRQQQDKEAGVVQGAVQIFNTIEQMRRGSAMGAQQAQSQTQAQQDQAQLGGASALQQQQNSLAPFLALGTEALGSPTTTVNENIKGRGQQQSSGSQMSAGITCCFIFLEGLNGKLPEYVRRGRDEFVTKERAKGYRVVSRWLVPAMQKSRVVRWLTNAILIKPFLLKGKWHYAERCTPRGHAIRLALAPICWSWIGLWQVIGKYTKDSSVLWQH